MKDLIRTMVLFMVLGITAITISCSLFGRYDAPIEEIIANEWFLRSSDYGPAEGLPDGALFLSFQYSTNSNHYVFSFRSDNSFELKFHSNGVVFSTFHAKYQVYSNTLYNSNMLLIDFNIITNVQTNNTNIVKYDTEYMVTYTRNTNEMYLRGANTIMIYSMMSNIQTNLAITNTMFDPMYFMASNNIKMESAFVIIGTTQYNFGN